VPVFTWNKYVSGERFRAVAREWESFIEETGAEYYVVNTQNVTAHDAADKQWLAETWIPSLIGHGVECGAGVYADSAIASMDMGRIESQLSAIDPGFEFRVFATDAEAKNWLAGQ
jgi:hypothetical protein